MRWIRRWRASLPASGWTRRRPGAEAIWALFLSGDSVWEDRSFEWGELIEVDPDKIVANQVRELRGIGSGASVPWSCWIVCTFRDGKVLRFEWFADRAEALEAAGRSES